MTYLADGVQYITVMVGWGGGIGLINPPVLGPIKRGYGRILTFAIGETTTLEVPPFGHAEPPVPAIQVNASRKTIEEGRILYDSFCFWCHGVAAVAGPPPDLRYSTAEVHRQFEEIVLGGAREGLGMPSFGDLLTAEQARAIQAYVLFRAAEPDTPSN